MFGLYLKLSGVCCQGHMSINMLRLTAVIPKACLELFCSSILKKLNVISLGKGTSLESLALPLFYLSLLIILSFLYLCLLYLCLPVQSNL